MCNRRCQVWARQCQRCHETTATFLTYLELTHVQDRWSRRGTYHQSGTGNCAWLIWNYHSLDFLKSLYSAWKYYRDYQQRLNETWVGELNHDPARIRIEPLGRCSGLGFDSSLKHSSPHPCEYEICNWEFTIDIDGIAISVKFVGRMTWGIEFTVKKGILMGGCVTEKIFYFQHAKPHRWNTF